MRPHPRGGCAKRALGPAWQQVGNEPARDLDLLTHSGSRMMEKLKCQALLLTKGEEEEKSRGLAKLPENKY